VATIGAIGWLDLTVDDAETTRSFYEQVVGWTSAPVSMGEYDDHVVHDSEGNPVAGICHRRGGNSNLPPAWLPYVNVESLDAALEKVVALGGAVLDGPKDAGDIRYAIIRDPAGAFLAIASP